MPNRKVARLTVKDLIAYFDPDDNSKKFLKVPESDILPHLEQLQNKGLVEVKYYINAS